eukprot:m.161645 g.161645  ORF g.161645 m.161645 type:complete len:264 (-) comp16530_c1_seq12:4875-5666(-)
MHEDHLRCVRCLQSETQHVWNIHAARDLNLRSGYKARSTQYIEQILASSMATMAVATFVSPINMVKVRVQATPLPITTSGAVKQLWKENGVRAFYTALPISLGMSVTSGIVYIMSYEACRDYLAARVLPSNQLGYAPLMAGFGSRVLCSVLFSPLELVAIRVQSSSNPSILRTVGNIWSHDGAAGFYRGLGVTLLRDAPFSAVYWALMTDFKERLTAFAPAWTSSNGFATTFLAAGSACFGAALVTQPMDLVKTRLQASPDRL